MTIMPGCLLALRGGHNCEHQYQYRSTSDSSHRRSPSNQDAMVEQPAFFRRCRPSVHIAVGLRHASKRSIPANTPSAREYATISAVSRAAVLADADSSRCDGRVAAEVVRSRRSMPWDLTEQLRGDFASRDLVPDAGAAYFWVRRRWNTAAKHNRYRSRSYSGAKFFTR